MLLAWIDLLGCSGESSREAREAREAAAWSVRPTAGVARESVGVGGGQVCALPCFVMAVMALDRHHLAMTLQIGMLLYPRLTQLDLTGPFEVLHRVPDARVHLVWKDMQPVRADSGLGLLPTTTCADCPPLDIVFVPGGSGQVALMADQEVLGFLRRQAGTARYITSVCTGALILGAAGLLAGYDATTHWAFVQLLPAFGARHVPGRVVVDRNRITGGGITAGIDFALRLVAELAGEDVAKAIQLGIEYDPAPPFRSGHPDVADPALVARLRKRLSVLTSQPVGKQPS